jgi:hypothetical protein
MRPTNKVWNWLSLAYGDATFDDMLKRDTKVVNNIPNNIANNAAGGAAGAGIGGVGAGGAAGNEEEDFVEDAQPNVTDEQKAVLQGIVNQIIDLERQMPNIYSPANIQDDVETNKRITCCRFCNIFSSTTN